VKRNGQIYEAILAAIDRRKRYEIYHAALEGCDQQGRFTIELAPVPDMNGTQRGVVGEGPVGSRLISGLRIFRYELRCWPDGKIPDAEWAVGSPRIITGDEAVASQLRREVSVVPMLVWGRDEVDAGEMWNSNSVIAWLLVRCGFDLNLIDPPAGGRAPGWDAGRKLALRDRLV